jgi:transketolase
MLEHAKKLVDEWAKQGKYVTLLSMHTIKPLDVNIIQELIDKGMPIITLEEHNVVGGLGSAVAEVIAESGKGVKFKRVGIPDVYSHHVGNQKFLREKFALNTLCIDF